MNCKALILALGFAAAAAAAPTLAAEPAKKQRPTKTAKVATSTSEVAPATQAEIEAWKDKPFVKRFKRADANGDGKLSNGEADRGYTPELDKDFAAMDTTKDGAVTLQERSAFNMKTAERKAAAKSKDQKIELRQDKVSKPKQGEG